MKDAGGEGLGVSGVGEGEEINRGQIQLPSFQADITSSSERKFIP